MSSVAVTSGRTQYIHSGHHACIFRPWLIVSSLWVLEVDVLGSFSFIRLIVRDPNNFEGSYIISRCFILSLIYWHFVDGLWTDPVISGGAFRCYDEVCSYGFISRRFSPREFYLQLLRLSVSLPTSFQTNTAQRIPSPTPKGYVPTLQKWNTIFFRFNQISCCFLKPVSTPQTH